jgi:hypothetical protein
MAAVAANPSGREEDWRGEEGTLGDVRESGGGGTNGCELVVNETS